MAFYRDDWLCRWAWRQTPSALVVKTDAFENSKYRTVRLTDIASTLCVRLVDALDIANCQGSAPDIYIANSIAKMELPNAPDILPNRRPPILWGGPQ
ncbi:hypothetical protein [Brucella anthropi]|uniref:hypothetical protein n=1 Tax=Brucella anthropi TaxID=529 RepID=UPI0039869C53